MAGLGSYKPGEGNGIGGIGGGGKGGTKYGYYLGQVERAIQGALSSSAKLKTASFARVKVRVSADSTGRIVRVTLVGTTGDAAIDDAIRNDVLKDLQLPEPPSDLPMPIVLGVNAKRPNGLASTR
jgi:membrane protein involved in colicin uptake